MKYLALTLALLAVFPACLTYAAPNVGEYENPSLDISKADSGDDDSDENNLLFPYVTLRRPDEIERRSDSVDERKYANRIPLGAFIDSEREFSSRSDSKISPNVEVKTQASAGAILPDPLVHPSDMEKIRSIAFNNREVKLVGPDKKEAEVKSDVATQMLIALDNLQKEASDVWGQVNVKLDKGWTDFKTMIENAVAKQRAASSSSRHLRETNSKDISSLVLVSDVDGYSMADEGDLSKQAESAGAKIKGFLSNIGINEENGKKANEALSKAGASVSETVTKDLPDALKKAGTAVSDTVTKDIPEAFKNFFG